MEDLPTEVQIALFDLAFQVGPEGVRGKGDDEYIGGLGRQQFKDLFAALSRWDWRRAGEEMNVGATPNRGPVRAERAELAVTPRSFFTTDPLRASSFRTSPLLEALLGP